MPCDTVNRRIRVEEQVRAQQERERALARLEQELEQGIAQIVVNQDGSVQLLGTLPAGMQEACVLAALQLRCSAAFQYALQVAGVNAMDFVQIHNRSHGR
jgi:hypothetical protein